MQEDITPGEFCAIRTTIRLLGKQWTMLIIHELFCSKKKTLSFMDLSRSLKEASSKVLSERLKEMIENDLVKRRVDESTKPPHVYYTLTSKGKDAHGTLDAFKEFGIRWSGKNGLDCKRTECELCPKRLD